MPNQQSNLEQQQIKEKQNKIYWLALASLFLGLISFLWGIAGVIAIILGIISLKQIKKRGLKDYRELAVLGIILGAIGVAWWFMHSYLLFRSLFI